MDGGAETGGEEGEERVGGAPVIGEQQVGAEGADDLAESGGGGPGATGGGAVEGRPVDFGPDKGAGAVAAADGDDAVAEAAGECIEQGRGASLGASGIEGVEDVEQKGERHGSAGEFLDGFLPDGEDFAGGLGPGAGLAVAGDGGAVPGAGEGLADSGGEAGGIVVPDNDAEVRGSEHFRDGSDAGGHDRRAAGEGFVDDIRPAFTAGGEAEEVRGGHGAGEGFRREDAEEMDEGGEAGVLSGTVEGRGEVGTATGATGDPEVGGNALGVQEREGLDQLVVAFEFDQVAGGEEMGPWGVHAETGAGVCLRTGVEDGGIKTVGDDADARGGGAERNGEGGERLGDSDDPGSLAAGGGEGAAACGVAGVVLFVAPEGDGEGHAEGAGKPGGGAAFGVAPVGVDEVEGE